MLVGAWIQHLSAGLTASLGALVFLYLPETSLLARLHSLSVSCVVMLVSYGIGMLSASGAMLQVIGFAIVTTITTQYCRVFTLGGPPGSLFFVIAASIGAAGHYPLMEWLPKMTLVAIGCLWGLVVALSYSLLVRTKATSRSSNSPVIEFRKNYKETIFIGFVVGISLVMAQTLQLDNLYWVPISCLAVIQGDSLREVWRKQLHRMIGTSLGLFLVSFIFLFPLVSDFQIAFWLVLLTFLIELTVASHYATAVMFITPMTVLLANAGHASQTSLSTLARARLLDTAIGCFLGLCGGFYLHTKQAGKLNFFSVRGGQNGLRKTLSSIQGCSCHGASKGNQKKKIKP